MKYLANILNKDQQIKLLKSQLSHIDFLIDDAEMEFEKSCEVLDANFANLENKALLINSVINHDLKWKRLKSLRAEYSQESENLMKEYSRQNRPFWRKVLNTLGVMD